MSRICIGQVYEITDDLHKGPELLVLIQCDMSQVVALRLSQIQGISPNRWVEPVNVNSAYDISEDELAKILCTNTGGWKYVGMIGTFLELRENVNVQVL